MSDNCQFMDTNQEVTTLKRRRSLSSSSNEGDRSKAWDDASFLDEMGVVPLGSDVYTSDEGEINEIMSCLSSDCDDTENVNTNTTENNPTDDNAVFHEKKKRRPNDHREPLKEQQQTILEDTTNLKTEDKTLEKLKPANCVIKNSQVVYGHKKSEETEVVSEEKVKGKRDVCNNTEEVCNNEFKLSRLPRRDSVRKKDHFSELPEEVIVEIFKYLDRRSLVRCCQVSHKLNNAAVSDCLWSRVDLGGWKIKSGELGYMLRRSPLIVRLASTVIESPIFLPKQLPSNFQCSIQYLDLSMASITEKELALFLGMCTRLKKLSVENCKINHDVAVAISRNPGLEVLNMTMTSGHTISGLTEIFTKCERLQSLNLGWTSLTAAAVSAITRKISPSVERLNISGCRLNIKDDDIKSIVKRCENLIELDISDSIDLSVKSIEHIKKYALSLEYLAISRCYNIPLTSLHELNSLPSLTYLDLFGMTSEPELKKLKASLEEKTLNQFMFSSVARPTVGVRRTSIWGLRVRDN